MPFQFTRYLYAADDVRAALTISILNKADEAALFWAYELFHSEYDLMGFFWKLYYDFYATLNPAFEKYLLTKFKYGMTEPKLVATIVGNFVIRPHNMDIFLLRNLPPTPFHFENAHSGAFSRNACLVSAKSNGSMRIFDAQRCKENVADLASTDYCATATAVMNGQVTLEQVLGHYAVQGVKKVVADFKKQTDIVAPNLLLLTRIMQYESKLKKLKMGKNMYIQIEDADVEPYATLRLDKPRKILSTVGLRDIDEHKSISLFGLARDTADIVKAYRDDWLYAASFSPLWRSRIMANNGTIDDDKKEVTFECDDDLEQFYEKHGLEPDEQRLEIQQKSTGGAISQDATWHKFYSKNGLVKENEQGLGKVAY